MGLGVKRLSQSGFSLIEMAIVIAVIGLVIGGIMGGRSLIRDAGITNIGVALTKYSDATFQFKKLYGALPGDMSDATNYWGVANATPATCKTTATGDKRTCNGDGDGSLESGLTGTNELFRFWQHLAAAELISGSYSGVQGPLGVVDVLPGLNAPKSTLKGSTYYAESMGALVGQTQDWDARPTPRIGFGRDNTVSSGDANAPILSSREAKALDDKFDDGLPQSGFFVTRKDVSSCNTTTSMTTARYNVATDTRSCTLFILMRRHWDKG